MTITQRLSSDGKIRTLSVISTLNYFGFERSWEFSLWQHSANLFGEDLPAGHTNNKLAAGIFPPRSLTRQYDWLTKITWDITHAIPRVGEKTFGKIWVLQVLLKNFTSEKCWKIVCYPVLFTSKLQQGPFCREKVFCRSCCKLRVSSVSVKAELVQLVVRRISRRLLQASLDGTVCIYA